MSIWLGQHWRIFGDTLARFVRQPLASLLNVAVIGIALALPTGLYVALDNLQSFAQQYSAEPQLSVFLALDAARSDAQALETRLRQHASVAKVEFVPREKAFADLKQGAGMAEVLDSLPQNPLPDAFVLHAKTGAPEAMERLRDEIARWPKVAHVQFDAAWARRLEAALRLGRAAVLLLAALLSVALVAVTFNTIRLQILTQRDEIEVSQLIGATRPFIRRPFLYFGALQGLAGGLAAWVIIAGTVTLLNIHLAELARLYASDFRLRPLDQADSLSLLAFSGWMGWLGAWLSVSRHLGQPVWDRRS